MVERRISYELHEATTKEVNIQLINHSTFYCLVAGDLPHLNAIAFALEDRSTLCKFNCLFNGGSLYKDKASYGFFNVAKWTIGYNIVVPYYFRFVERKACTTGEFVLRGDSANPIHSLFHPYLDLFGGCNLHSIRVPED
jgi:hypothetical protein